MTKINLSESIKTGSLIGKYIAGKESESEHNQLKCWSSESADNHDIFNALKDKKNIADSIEEYESFDKELAWEKYKNRLYNLSVKRILFRWKVAAVFFFLIGCAGIITYLNKELTGGIGNNEIYTSISTGKGQNSKVVLPDGSIVWINSESTLSYNSNFAENKRDVKLVGEAFFDVARNEKKPLTITSNGFKVKVLGTKFDVSAYANDKNIKVILESGKVEIFKPNDNTAAYTMSPGEKAEYDPVKKEIIINQVNVTKFTSWKDGFLVFKNDHMDEVFRRLERWYDIEIKVEDEKINKMLFNATIVNENVEEIFELIKYTCAVNYKIIPSKNPDVPVRIIISTDINQKNK